MRKWQRSKQHSFQLNHSCDMIGSQQSQLLSHVIFITENIQADNRTAGKTSQYQQSHLGRLHVSTWKQDVVSTGSKLHPQKRVNRRDNAGREVRAKTTDYNWSNVPRNYTRNVDQKREKLWNFSQIKNNNVLNIASPLQTPSVFHVRPLSTRQSDDKILFSCHHRSILPFSKWAKMLHLQDSHLYSIRN